MSTADSASLSASSSTSTSQDPVYDNNGQYTRSGILRYEKVFGDGYISTGGHETTLDLCRRLGESLRPGARILDVGSGIGGAAFHLANAYQAKVTGVDLAPEMVAIAKERARQADGSDSVRFILGDVLAQDFPEPFDIIWSRDALMHVHDKPQLFERLYSLLDDDGTLIVTDYSRGDGPASAAFESYIENTGYHVVPPPRYGQLLEAAGFVEVEAEDVTERFITILKEEMARLESDRDDFLKVFTKEDLTYLLERWAMKVEFCEAGDMKWAISKARRRD